MRRMPERRPSIEISDEITGSRIGGARTRTEHDATARIIALPLAQATHFDTLDVRFFDEGDEMSKSSDCPDGHDDLAFMAIAHPERRARRRWPLLWLTIGATAIVVLALATFARRHAPIPILATAPAPARPVPSPPLAAAGAVASLPSDEAREEDTRPGHPDAPTATDTCRIAFAQHRPSEVIERCAQAFSKNPDSADIAAMLAKTEFDRGHSRQALDWAKKAVTIDENHADAYVYLGGAEQAAGHPSAARAAYKRYLQLAPRGRYAADLRAVLRSL
jgi:tetratricopeptide (TPR) repeat protein